MGRVSISQAWDETKDIVARDGRLFVSVSLALIALPTALTGLLNPEGMTYDSPWWVDVLMLIASLVALAGQLALIRLALGPSITVGGAIGHGFQRMPFYLLSAIIVLVLLLVLAIPFGAALALLGVSPGTTLATMPPAASLVLLAYVILVCVLAVRLVLAAPSASAENIGPVAILKRTWALTAGQWWPLFGFLVIFFIGAVVVLLAVAAAAGLLAAVLFGAIEPMSVAALVTSLFQALANAVITTLFAVMLARIYVQLAGRGEVHASVPSSGT